MNEQLKREPVVIDQSRVADGILFAAHGDRCRYLGKSHSEKPDWLKEHEGRWRRIEDARQDAALLAPLAESDTKVGAAPAGPNSQASSCDVRNDSDDEDDTVLVDTLPGDYSPLYQSTLLPTPVKANAPNGSTKAKLLPLTKAVMRETQWPKTESTPLEAMGRKRRRSGHQLKKKRPAEVSKAGRKLSPERMRIVIESLREYPILSHAASTAGIHHKTLEYWMKCSKAGKKGYDIEWQGVMWRFHEHCQTAIEEAHDKILLAVWDSAMGGVVYKTDQALVDLGYQGTDAYLKDENGNPVIETIRNPNGKMIRWLLERLRPDKFGNRKIDVPQERGVLVVGATPKKLKNSTATAASIRARKWKVASRMIRKAES